MPLCTEKQARASKYIDDEVNCVAYKIITCRSMVQVRPSADLLVPEDKPYLISMDKPGSYCIACVLIITMFCYMHAEI